MNVSGRTWLVYLLRFDAAVLTLAFAAVFLTPEFMRRSNEILGLSPIEFTPLFDYLTRSLALLYGARGLFVWLASTDLERYRPFVVLIGASNILIGVLLLGIDLYAGMPLYWTLGEGPGVMIIGALVLWLTHRFVPQQARARA